MSMATRMRGWLISALGSSLCVTGQIAQFEVKEDKILIRMSSGETREALAAGVDRNSVRISPDGSRLIWHLEFAGYGHDPQIPVRLWSPSRPEKIEEFRVPTLSRYINSVEWIDNRLVLFAGDGYGVLVDSENGALVHGLPGADFTVSPDRKRILYWLNQGRSVPRFVSDEAMLAVLGAQPRPSNGVKEIRPGVYKLYPPEEELSLCASLNWSADRPECRHRALTPFAWFSDSRRAVFLEWHEGTVWVVMLILDMNDSSISVRQERFALPLTEENLLDRLPWLKQDEELEFEIEGKRVIVNPVRKTVRWDAPR